MWVVVEPDTYLGLYKCCHYAHALSRSDTDLLMLLFETYGGWSEPVHWSITGRFTEPVTNNIVLIFLLAISASNTICMHCIHIV